MPPVAEKLLTRPVGEMTVTELNEMDNELNDELNRRRRHQRCHRRQHHQ
jgi:hypothetical protein